MRLFFTIVYTLEASRNYGYLSWQNGNASADVIYFVVIKAYFVTRIILDLDRICIDCILNLAAISVINIGYGSGKSSSESLTRGLKPPALLCLDKSKCQELISTLYSLVNRDKRMCLLGSGIHIFETSRSNGYLSRLDCKGTEFISYSIVGQLDLISRGIGY